ncbi:hypothetical protein GCM10009601_48550 [Streptomyces thermospinosisporus]|uniref:Uncharacterized protein n=1 Tax=Streptomyces thermospinosisporus TaxID=161482 RepID=A0ABN1Z3Y2_9ACTN
MVGADKEGADGCAEAEGDVESDGPEHAASIRHSPAARVSITVARKGRPSRVRAQCGVSMPSQMVIATVWLPIATQSDLSHTYVIFPRVGRSDALPSTSRVLVCSYSDSYGVGLRHPSRSNVRTILSIVPTGLRRR